MKEQYIKGIELEWRIRQPLLVGRELKTLYFGGGTPYLLGPKAMKVIIDRVSSDLSCNIDDIEITLEANPEDIDIETLSAYRDIGINRLSMGLQSLDPELLTRLGRLHTAQKGIDAIHTAVKAGITNISVDLMYDLPGQTLEAWKHTLHIITEQPIAHLSLYNLTIEPYTHFHKHRETLLPLLPDAEISADMYLMAQEYCSNGGLKQYEISAFARNNQLSIHNTGYWHGRDFLGLGPSAFSYWAGKRFRNIANLSKYLKLLEDGKSPVDYEEQLTKAESLRELFVLGLRLTQGVNLQKFQQEHGNFDAETWAAISTLCKQELLVQKDESLKMTSRGILFYDTIATELI